MTGLLAAIKREWLLFYRHAGEVGWWYGRQRRAEYDARCRVRPTGRRGLCHGR